MAAISRSLQSPPIILPHDDALEAFDFNYYLGLAIDHIRLRKPFAEMNVENGKGETIFHVACLEAKDNSPLDIAINHLGCRHILKETFDLFATASAPRCQQLSIETFEASSDVEIPLSDQWFRTFATHRQVKRLLLNSLEEHVLSKDTLASFAHEGLTVLTLEMVEAANNPECLRSFAQNCPQLASLQLWNLASKAMFTCLPLFAKDALASLSIELWGDDAKTVNDLFEQCALRCKNLSSITLIITLESGERLFPKTWKLFLDPSKFPALKKLNISGPCCPDITVDRTAEHRLIKGGGGGGSA